MTQSAAGTRPFEGLQIPAPGTYVLDAAHKRVGFVAKHLRIAKVRGHCAEATATITIGPTVHIRAAVRMLDGGSMSSGAPGHGMARCTERTGALTGW